ncbi:MAG: glycyl-radical enzyme activating protein [Clostridia bacterium]|nr:glycyl-radical enzyme activating protein [Clostridia bacterium]
MTATIFEIKRFAVHDGDGIRTTVFFKGCPLRCVWCHNPEGLTASPQTAYYKHKCIGCCECRRSDFSVENCLGEARVLYGREMSVDELLPILLEDKDFYETSGGGVTLSGGECLMQAEFCAELLKLLKEKGINTAVDTCGFVTKKALDLVLPYADTFLYDIKSYDEDVHIRCTGVSNKPILENMSYLNSLGKNIEIRIPYVPDYNDNQIEKIARFLAPLQSITKVRVLPYHNYAATKYASLDLPNTLPERIPTNQEIQKAAKIIKKFTNFAIIY